MGTSLTIIYAVCLASRLAFHLNRNPEFRYCSTWSAGGKQTCQADADVGASCQRCTTASLLHLPSNGGVALAQVQKHRRQRLPLSVICRLINVLGILAIADPANTSMHFSPLRPSKPDSALEDRVNSVERLLVVLASSYSVSWSANRGQPDGEGEGLTRF